MGDSGEIGIRNPDFRNTFALLESLGGGSLVIALDGGSVTTTLDSFSLAGKVGTDVIEGRWLTASHEGEGVSE